MEDKFSSDTITEIPVLPLLERPIFPETLTTLMVSRPVDIRTVTWAIEHDGYFLAVIQETNDEKSLRQVGTLVKITKFIKLPNSSIHLFTTAIKRVKVTRYVYGEGPVFADGETLVDKPSSPKTIQPYTRILKDLVASLGKTRVFNPTTEINIANFNSPEAACWYAAAALVSAPKDFLQELLEETDTRKRITSLTSYISGEKEVLEKEEQVREEYIERVKMRNKEAIIKEQIKALNGELGALRGGAAVDPKNAKKGDIFERATAKELPALYREAVDKELEKLSYLDTMNPEYMLTKLYIETILDLPFSFTDEAPAYSIIKVREQLEKDHYGMKEVKERIVEFLASRLKAQNSKGAVICLAGPPGVGKTSVGSSIAKALGRKFYRFSVGGMRDEAEIKGHRRTYVGAMPGKLIQAVTAVGVTDPVILIDEIDKMGQSYNGDPASALLEVLDPEQNISFRDFYLDLPYDLSKVLFIVTANDLSKIPRPLYDRMEIIEMSGYTPAEKLHIGKEYLVPDLLKKNGLTKKEIKFDDNALSHIAEEYAREAGVRQFKNEIDKVMRKVALKILETPEEERKTVKITAKDLKGYLDLPPFPSDRIVVADTVGMAMGLAWTAFGGDVIPVEAVSIPEKGDLKVTGQLGDVMKESVSIAWSTVKHEAWLRGLDMKFFEKNSVHLHCPEGAVPKDGPSAGITLFTALWSMYRRIPAKEKLAMTGELTLTGKVEAIGGLKEKILGARRNSIREIIIPYDNLRDLEKLDKEVKGDVIFHTVKTILDVIAIAFPTETSGRLSKDELEIKMKENTEKEEEEKEAQLALQAEAFSKAFRTWQ